MPNCWEYFSGISDSLSIRKKLAKLILYVQHQKLCSTRETKVLFWDSHVMDPSVKYIRNKNSYEEEKKPKSWY